MFIRFTMACMLVVAALGGCATEAPEPATEERAVSSVLVDEPALGDTAAVRTCFTCDLDPSVRACSSIPSNAQHRCNRACFECIEFNGVEECFFGLCTPD
jgi:hypothetical protein